MALDSRVNPSTGGPRCGANRSRVADKVSNDRLTAWVSVSAVLLVSSLVASFSEYGDDVRLSGMTLDGRRWRCPAGSRVKTRCPSSVAVRMWAVVSEPSRYLAV